MAKKEAPEIKTERLILRRLPEANFAGRVCDIAYFSRKI